MHAVNSQIKSIGKLSPELCAHLPLNAQGIYSGLAPLEVWITSSGLSSSEIQKLQKFGVSVLGRAGQRVTMAKIYPRAHIGSLTRLSGVLRVDLFDTSNTLDTSFGVGPRPAYSTRLVRDSGREISRMCRKLGVLVKTGLSQGADGRYALMVMLPREVQIQALRTQIEAKAAKNGVQVQFKDPVG